MRGERGGGKSGAGERLGKKTQRPALLKRSELTRPWARLWMSSARSSGNTWNPRCFSRTWSVSLGHCAMDISVSIVIARPVEAVFEFVSNYERDPRWRTGVLEMM